MKIILKDESNIQKTKTTIDNQKYSENLYKKKVEFLKSIGLHPNIKPDFQKLAEYFQSEIKKEIAYELVVSLNKKTGFIEVSSRETNTITYNLNDKFSYSYKTPNLINFKLDMQIISEAKEPVLQIDLKLDSDLDGATFRSSIFGKEEAEKYTYLEEDEETFQEYDTLLPMEETMQIQMYTHLYLDAMDREGRVETVLIKCRLD
jgi:hypothetical protein